MRKRSFYEVEGVEEMLTYKRKVNYYETDSMSIVHHSNYIRYFEEARLFWHEKMGLPYEKMEELGIIVPVTFVDCQYKKPLHYGDEIEIAVHLKKYNGVKMEVSYEIFRGETKELCTTGTTGHCFLDRDMKPIAMKRKYPQIYDKMSALLQTEKQNTVE